MSRRILQAKKFMASKLSESSAGRQVVIKFLGASGDHLLHAIDSAFVKHSGKTVAKQMRLNIFKLATKIGVLAQNHAIEEQQMALVRDPAMSLLQYLVDLLEMPVTAASRDLAQLRVLITQVHDALLPVFMAHMKESNYTRLTELYQFIISDFLDDFFLGANYELEREELTKSLQKLTQPFESEVLATKEFLRDRMQARRNLLAQLLQRPHLEDYLRYEDTGKSVRDWLVQQSPANINHLNFINAVQDFKLTSSRTLSDNRAQTIYDKHILESSPACVSLSTELVSGILAHFDEGKLRKDMFDAAVNFVLGLMSAEFESSFCQSEQFMDLQHELEMINFKLAVQYRINADEADVILEEVPSDDEEVEALDPEALDEDMETKT